MSKVKSNYEIISDKTQNPVVDSTYVKHGTGWLDTVINQATSALNTKADKTYVDTQLATKANSSDVSALQTTVQSKADSSTVSALSGRVDDVESEQDTLSARMDTFTTLPEGSTTGDAELADAHVGVDGKTYTNVGGAIRGQITDLRNDLNDITNKSSIAKSVPVVLNINGYVTDSGTITTASSWKRSDYIELENSGSVLIDVPDLKWADVVSSIAFFDFNMKFVSGVTYTSNVDKILTDVPVNATYFVVSNVATQRNNYNGYLIHNYENELEKNVENIKFIFESSGIESYANVDMNIDGYVSVDGDIRTNTSWCRTDYISLNGAKGIKLSYPDGIGAADIVSNISFFDMSKQFISGIALDKIIGYTTAKVPSNAFYVVISSIQTSKENITLDFYCKSEGGGTSNNIAIIVDKNGNGDYLTVSEAVANAVTGDVIFVKNGVYENEHVKGWGKEIAIIGESPLNTVVTCSDSTYSNPTLEFSTGVLRNLTFELTNSDASGYVFHSEDAYQYGRSLFVENCIFKSPKINSIGMGMHGNSKITFKGCEFWADAEGPCFYLHDADKEEYAGTYDVNIINCTFHNKGNWIVTLQSQEKTNNTVYIGFYNNIFECQNKGINPYIYTKNFYGGTSTNPDDFKGLINWRLKKDSCGNNFNCLNVLPKYEG